MHKYSFLMILSLTAMTMCFLTSLCVGGNDIQVTKIRYVDYDGDGFDDLTADNNENGIPDEYERRDKAPVVEVTGLLGDVFNESPPSEEVYLSNEEAYSARDFAVRFMSAHRAGLNADDAFGPGNGVGIGNVAGGCEGGVCH